MSKKWLLLLLLLPVCMTGCVPVDSINPFYTEKNAIFDPALVGKWGGPNPDEGGLRFDRTDGNAYQMVMTGRKSSDWVKESVFVVHLLSLGGEKYLDVEPREFESSPQQLLFSTDALKKGSKFEPSLEKIGSGIYMEVTGPNPGKGASQELQVKIRPAHWIFKVYLSEKSLSLSFLDREWLHEQIEKKLIQARHLKAKDDDGQSWVLSGSTAELQQFVVQHADDPGAFDAGMAMSKIE
jgi:hypothetical protein